MGDICKFTIRVKNLPVCLGAKEREDFLGLFGATKVKAIPVGRDIHVVGKFPSKRQARIALRKLKNCKLRGIVVRAEYVKKKDVDSILGAFTPLEDNEQQGLSNIEVSTSVEANVFSGSSDTRVNTLISLKDNERQESNGKETSTRLEDDARQEMSDIDASTSLEDAGEIVQPDLNLQDVDCEEVNDSSPNQLISLENTTKSLNQPLFVLILFSVASFVIFLYTVLDI